MEQLKTAKFVGGLAVQAENALMDGVITIECPHCKTERLIEPDGFSNDTECENCGKHYKTIGIC